MKAKILKFHYAIAKYALMFQHKKVRETRNIGKIKKKLFFLRLVGKIDDFTRSLIDITEEQMFALFSFFSFLILFGLILSLMFFPFHSLSPPIFSQKWWYASLDFAFLFHFVNETFKKTLISFTISQFQLQYITFNLQSVNIYLPHHNTIQLLCLTNFSDIFFWFIFLAFLLSWDEPCCSFSWIHFIVKWRWF